ncbi:hypothetical protein HHK36_017470 [Tetracentron sinense]|uniref:K Homology domain-containing protein n=1 Tax=Tetracentron sinense TaxID=13715 RepID=A0A834Z1C9_TETSI|nr:hypothetical protein HHK36_017470 [Tetracentron sinense]
MATKVDQVSAVEPRRVQANVITTSSAASASSPKVSMFGAKTGFVIPKNKLSGSLVPVSRGGGKLEGSDAAKEESTKQVQRKTKWGTDLTQDAAVRRGRALAYQTRVEQITQQLKVGLLETGDDQGSESLTQVSNHESSIDQTTNKVQKLELLELEKREAIGEILKLNPSYKAPADYKPLLKEARVPIPLKAYPGYNFIGLILGPGSDTQKRLEEETGAKIQVHGTKAGTGEKGEITVSDRNEVQDAYEDLYVHVSADTFEKVDAAVSLIELLVTPVSGNAAVVSTTTSVSGDSVNVFDQSQDSATVPMMPIPVVNQGVVQPMMGATQSGPLQGQFKLFPNPWFSVGPPHTQIRPPSGFVPLPNSSAPMPNNPILYPVSPHNPSNMPQFFGGRPPSASGYGSFPGNPSLVAPRPQPPMQVLQRPYMPEVRPASHVGPPRNYPMPGPQPLLAYGAMQARPNPGLPPLFTINQPPPIGSAPVGRPSMPSMPQQGPTAPSGPIPNRPYMPEVRPATGSTIGWSSSAVTPVSLGPGNMVQTALPQRPHPPSNMPATVLSQPGAVNVVSPVTFPSRPSTPQFPNTHINRPATTPAFASVPPQVRPGASSSASSAPPAPVPAGAPSPTSLRSSGPLPAPSFMASPTPASLSIFPRAPNLAQATAVAPASALVPIQSSSPLVPTQPLMGRSPVPNPSPSRVSGSSLVPPSAPSTSPRPQSGLLNPISGNLQNFTLIKAPPVTAPKPQCPSSGDFTFQPLRSHVPASQTVPRPSSQPMAQNTLTMPPKPVVQPPLAPQAPSFRPAVQSSAQLGMQSFPGSQGANQSGQPQALIPPPLPGSVSPFASNPTAIPPPPRIPAFQNSRPVLPTTTPQMGSRSFSSALQMPHLAGSLPPRSPNPMQMLQIQLAPTSRPGNLMVLNHPINNSPSFASGKPPSSPSGGYQVYDPFSPTSISSAPLQQADDSAKGRKQENDPEYEDLMASVGVR